MKKTFDKIEEFFSVKEKCIFCKNKMKVILTNFVGSLASKSPSLSSKVDENYIFNFNVKRMALGFINIKNNKISFKMKDRKSLHRLNIWGEDTNIVSDAQEALQCFGDMSPHLEICCSNKKCKEIYHYHLSSEIFSFSNSEFLDESDENFIIDPFLLYMESFTLDNWWIQNDFINNKLNIFSTNKTDLKPLQYDLMDFEDIDKNINKIKMMVNFS